MQTTLASGSASELSSTMTWSWVKWTSKHSLKTAESEQLRIWTLDDWLLYNSQLRCLLMNSILCCKVLGCERTPKYCYLGNSQSVASFKCSLAQINHIPKIKPYFTLACVNDGYVGFNLWKYQKRQLKESPNWGSSQYIHTWFLMWPRTHPQALLRTTVE